ncbi:hypothetical protein BJV82DRAFT_609817 [Fennellomyces sp. T-0311]|nr:hypothetical protein BJV82DRAFT_609817 [Fennellomyces sp. T-0311]
MRMKMDEINIARLTEEINEFTKYLEPTEVEIEYRDRAFARIRDHLKKKIPRAEVILSGSCQTKLLLPSSDINIAIRYPDDNGKLEKSAILSMVCCNLWGLDITVTGRYLREKVPMIRCREKHSNIDVTIQVDTYPNSWATTIEWMKEYPELKPLFLTIKHSAMGIRFEEGKGHIVAHYTKRGLSSYALVCLIAHYLKYNEAAKGFVDPVTRLGSLLLGFLRYYATFNFKTTGLTFGTADGLLILEDVPGLNTDWKEAGKRIVIQCANEAGQNVVMNCRNVALIQRGLAWMYVKMQNLCKSEEFQRSMLSCIINVEAHDVAVQRKSLNDYWFPPIPVSNTEINASWGSKGIRLSDHLLESRKRERGTDDPTHGKKRVKA